MRITIAFALLNIVTGQFYRKQEDRVNSFVRNSGRIQERNKRAVLTPKEDVNNAKAEKDDKKKATNATQGASSGEVTRVWVGTGAKVAPQQVENYTW